MNRWRRCVDMDYLSSCIHGCEVVTLHPDGLGVIAGGNYCAAYIHTKQMMDYIIFVTKYTMT